MSARSFSMLMSEDIRCNSGIVLEFLLKQLYWFTGSLCVSPEIVKSEPYGERADVWAAGCVLYQMATLRPPFYSNNMLSLATKVSSKLFSKPFSSTCAPCTLSSVTATEPVLLLVDNVDSTGAAEHKYLSHKNN